jgi:hypothetical protein
MKIQELLVELTSRANDFEHFKNRVKVAAKLCQGMGNHPLIFRAFFPEDGRETLLLKVQNQEGEKNRFLTKSGRGQMAQDDILSALNLKNPTFTTMIPPTGPREFHGYAHIFIPIGDHTPWWSPSVRDLGGRDAIDQDGTASKMQLKITGPVLNRSIEPGETDKWINTYQHAWPTERTNHELIFDCEEYYLLNLESLFNKFAGKEYKEYVTGYSHKSKKVNSILTKFDPLAFTKLTSYPQIADFLLKTLEPGGYLYWWENVMPKRKEDEARRAILISKIEQAWHDGGAMNNPKSRKEIADELGIPTNEYGGVL